MGVIEEMKDLINRNEIQEASINILEDVIRAFMGDYVSIGKIIIALRKSPFFIREQLFWTKMERFLNGGCLSKNDYDKLCSILNEGGKKEDNIRRLVEIIDRAETQEKILYLINATRCLLRNSIDKSIYFRICHAITHTLEEDLKFLGEHIEERDLPYNTSVQGLLTSGLMYQSVIDANNDQKYSFTPIAKIVDQCAVSYNNKKRYRNPEQLPDSFSDPQPKLPGIPEFEYAEEKRY